MVVRRTFITVVLLLGGGVVAQGQERSRGSDASDVSARRTESHAVASAPSATPTSAVFRLTGILVLPPIRRAFIEVENPGQRTRPFTLVEGQRVGDVELINIDAKRAKITLRYQGSMIEVKMTHQPNPRDALQLAENRRDASHIAAHVARAQLERERDERERREAAGGSMEHP